MALLIAACGGDDNAIAPLDIPTHGTSPGAGSTATTAAATPKVPRNLPATPPPPTRAPAAPPAQRPVAIECSPPSAEPAGTAQGSNLGFSGVCNFTETAKAQCTLSDDLVLQWQRATPDGPRVYYVVTIESYKGPGTYAQSVRMIFDIRDNGTVHEWDTQSGSATVDQGNRSGSIDSAALPADPGTPSRGTQYVSGTFACL